VDCGTVDALLLRDDGGVGLVRFGVEPCNRRSRETGYLVLATMMQMQNSGLERPQEKPLQILYGWKPQTRSRIRWLGWICVTCVGRLRNKGRLCFWAAFPINGCQWALCLLG